METLLAEIAKNPVAAYGAAVATIALCFSFLSIAISFWVALRDRAQIAVIGRSGYKVSPPGSYGPDQLFILITVSNLGRRPRTITHVGVKLNDGTQLTVTDSLHKGPQVVAEATAVSWTIAYGGNAKSITSIDLVRSVWACDQTGKIFRGKLDLAKEELEWRG